MFDDGPKAVNQHTIYSWGLLKKSTLDEFRFGLIFFGGLGFWRRCISRAAVLQEGGRHARSACIRTQDESEY